MNIDEAMSTPYKIDTEVIDSGHICSISQFPGLKGEGRFLHDAVNDLNANKKKLFQSYLDDKKEIPEPAEV